MTKPRIGWIGTGLMGSRMAANLLKAGFSLTVWNRTREKVQPLLDQGATWAASPTDLAAGVDVLMTSLTDGAAVGDVLIRQRAAAALRRGSLMIDLSSIAPNFARDHARLLATTGVAHLDAPVSGGTRGAAAASLAIMVGGAADDVERARPILSVLGRPTHVGPSGAGQIAKLANQVIVGVTLGAVAEALTLAARAGADPAAVRTALTGGFADSRILQEHGARMLAGDFVPGGTVKNQIKDLNTAIALADESHLDLPLLHATRAQFQAIADILGDQLDHSAIFKLLMEQSEPSKPHPITAVTLPGSVAGPPAG